MTATNKSFSKQSWFYEIVLVLLVLVIFAPMFYLQSFIKVNNDFQSHIELAIQLKEEGRIDKVDLARPAYQILLILINALVGHSFKAAAFLAAMACVILLTLVLYHWIAPTLQKRGISLWWGVAIVIGLNLVTPVSLLAPLDQRLYLGYIGITSYHSPTSILLKPFAILQFVFAFWCFREQAPSWLHVVAAALISLLTVLIKPTFTICILPAMGIMVAYRFLKRQRLNWRMIIFGFLLPSIAILAWQFLLVYYSNEEGGILFYPFGVMQNYSGYLLAKFLLSILFPLLVVIIYFKDACQDFRILLGWLIFLFGAFFSYFMAENGIRFRHGNFTWCGEIALYVLFCVSTLFFFEKANADRLKTLVLKLSWGLHAIFGIIYYFYCLLADMFK